MGSIDATAVGSVADTIALSDPVRLRSSKRISKGTHEDTHIKRFANPLAWYACAEATRKTIHVLSRGTAVVVYIALQSTFVSRVTDEKNALDSIEGSACESWHGVDSRLCSLRVALKDEALIGRGSQGAGDLIDDVSSSSSRVLTGTSGVDSVVDLATGDCRSDARVHCTKTR